MYVSPNFKTKKALKDAVAAGRDIDVFQPNDMFGARIPTDGVMAIEGPHYPEPHRWYARVTLQSGRVVKVS